MGKAEDIPGNGYDIIFSNSVLHWCEDKNLVFQQVEKSLKSGGTFGFVTPADFDFEEQFLSPMSIASPECRKAMASGIHIVPENELLRKISNIPTFSLVYFKKHYRRWRFQNVHELIEAHLTHFKGQFDSSHFNIEVMQERYGEGTFEVVMPYITAVLTKC